MSAADVIAKAMHDAYQYDANGADAKDILDALAAARYAVVELPKPYEDVPDVNEPYWASDDVSFVSYARRGGVWLETDAKYHSLTIAAARTSAAVILAAADAAEATNA